MKFRTCALARAGAVVLLAATAAALGAPAYAAGTETDLELTVVGTKVAANVRDNLTPWKIGWAKIANKGANTPRELSITADLSAVDLDKGLVLVNPFLHETSPDADCGAESEDGPVIWTCELKGSLIPGPGETVELAVFAFEQAGGPRPAYTFPVPFTINSPDDTNKANNSKTVDVVYSDESGVDLGVWVPDVKETPLPDSGESRQLRAGDTTIVSGQVFNWGDITANGVRVTVQLPEQVTFAEKEDECTYSADNRKATCEYGTLVLNPSSMNEEDDYVAAFYWPIIVSGDVEAPVTLPDGSWTAEALGQASPNARNARAAGALPDNVEMISAKEAGVNEVDASDNVDGFAVVVSADGGSGGGLPVTGVQAGVLGGVGAAVVVAGAVLVLTARRRRVVLVTPGDEKPTA
ncbi:hypothetical protein ACFP2T_38995 [Plantactinospora solaniradicis]|uniref:DUF11 domain-containing protein n=1 Tax=Plantactinospora solaniradicis TaxID=1723736 RepID=A0ABW1KML9_9ACTN